MKKKISKIAFFFCLPIVTFLTLGIFLVNGLVSGLASALSGNGGGYFVGSGSSFNISGNATLSGNSATNGGGVYVSNGGTLDMGEILRVDKDGNYSKTGDYVFLGSYPKTIKADTVSVDENNVDENGYFLGSDGERYAKFTANPYDSYSFSNGESINSGTSYFFKVEPIKWKILAIENGEALLLSETIVDSHRFSNTTEVKTVDGKTIYPNNYKESKIRTWLNSYFFNKAFSKNEQSVILTTVRKRQWTNRTFMPVKTQTTRCFCCHIKICKTRIMVSHGTKILQDLKRQQTMPWRTMATNHLPMRQH